MTYDSVVPEQVVVVPERGVTRYQPRPRVAGVRKAQMYNAICVALMWLVSIAAAFIWVYGRGFSNLFLSASRFLQELGALSGLIAGVLMLFQVLFMSRLPLFEVGLGRDVIVEIHKKAGFWSFWFILAHILFVVTGYAIARDQNPWVSIGALTWELRWAILATIAIFLAVILISLPRFKKQMSYDAWYWWHLVAYLGAFFTIPHQVFLGGSFLHSPVARYFWLTLWGITFGAVFIWRFLVPILNYFKYGMRVKRVTPDGARGVDLVIGGNNLTRLGTKGGQFFNWRFLGSPGWVRANPFSISAAPTDDELRVAVRVVGDGTERIRDLQPGQRVFVEGPYGRVSGDIRACDKMLMFGAGAGVGPMMSLLTDQQWAPGEAVLLQREDRESDAMMLGDIEELVNHRGLMWRQEIGLPAPSGSRWLPVGADGQPQDGVEVIRDLVGGDVLNVDVFLCGPPIWMRGVEADLAKAGVPAEHIHAETFAF
jgi:predicted ferric reductase